MAPFLQYLVNFMSIKINQCRRHRAKGLMANLIWDTRNSTQEEFDLYSRSVGICLCIFCIIKIYFKSLRLRERLSSHLLKLRHQRSHTKTKTIPRRGPPSGWLNTNGSGGGDHIKHSQCHASTSLPAIHELGILQGVD